MGKSKISSAAQLTVKSLIELDGMYPDRHNVIHKECCKNCPSANGADDPEQRDIKEHYSKGHIADEYLFVCAWRPSKLCKGNCDYFGIDQDYLNYHRHATKQEPQP